MSSTVFVSILGLFAPIVVAALTAYSFNKRSMVLSVIAGFIADVVVIATFASWTAGHWTIYDGQVGGAIWIPIVILWVVFSFIAFIAIDALMQDEAEVNNAKASEKTTNDMNVPTS